MKEKRSTAKRPPCLAEKDIPSCRLAILNRLLGGGGNAQSCNTLRNRVKSGGAFARIVFGGVGGVERAFAKGARLVHCAFATAPAGFGRRPSLTQAFAVVKVELFTDGALSSGG